MLKIKQKFLHTRHLSRTFFKLRKGKAKRLLPDYSWGGVVFRTLSNFAAFGDPLTVKYILKCFMLTYTKIGEKK